MDITLTLYWPEKSFADLNSAEAKGLIEEELEAQNEGRFTLKAAYQHHTALPYWEVWLFGRVWLDSRKNESQPLLWLLQTFLTNYMNKLIDRIDKRLADEREKKRTEAVLTQVYKTIFAYNTAFPQWDFLERLKQIDGILIGRQTTARVELLVGGRRFAIRFGDKLENCKHTQYAELEELQ